MAVQHINGQGDFDYPGNGLVEFSFDNRGKGMGHFYLSRIIFPQENIIGRIKLERHRPLIVLRDFLGAPCFAILVFSICSLPAIRGGSF